MRLTESRLRRIIRSVIRESLEGDTKISSMSREAFNKAYRDIMLDPNSEHGGISPDYAENADHYDMILRSLTDTYTNKRVGVISALNKIKCQSPLASEFRAYEDSRMAKGEHWDSSWEEEWYTKWFVNNASKIIECLNKADAEAREDFFGDMESAIHFA